MITWTDTTFSITTDPIQSVTAWNGPPGSVHTYQAYEFYELMRAWSRMKNDHERWGKR